MDDETQIVDTYLNTWDRKEIVDIHLSYVGIPPTEQAVAHWRSQSVFRLEAAKIKTDQALSEHTLAKCS